MIDIYIDDSGSVSLNDESQPILLFSAIYVPSKIYAKVKSEMEELVSKIIKDVKTKLISIGFNGGLKQTSKNFAKYILDVSKIDEFEIHCSEIMRGDGLYMILDKSDRDKYILDVLKLITKYDIDILTIYCDKYDYKIEYKNEKDIEMRKDFEISTQLIKNIEANLKELNEQGSITIDSGNKIINKVLIPKLDCGEIKLEHENISRNIAQVASNKNVLIQLADVVAYISNMKLSIDKKIKLGEKVKDNKVEKAKKFFNLIKSNSNIKNIQIKDDKVEKVS